MVAVGAQRGTRRCAHRHRLRPRRWCGLPALLLAATVVAATLVSPLRAECDPEIVIAGVPKCATTTLHHWLTSHPAVLPVEDKEPNFSFAHAPSSSLGQRYIRGRRSLDHNGGPSSGEPRRLSIDSTTHIAYNPTVIADLHRFCPTAKMIFVFCNPARRLVSHWNFRKYIWQWGRLQGVSLDSFVRDELDSLPEAWTDMAHFLETHSEREVWNSTIDLDPGFPWEQGQKVLPEWRPLRGGLYAILLRRALQRFPGGQIHVVIGDDMREDSRGVLLRIESFLEIPHHRFDDALLAAHDNANPYAHKDQPTAEDVGLVVDFYREHNAWLGHLLGRDLSAWDNPKLAV